MEIFVVILISIFGTLSCCGISRVLYRRHKERQKREIYEILSTIDPDPPSIDEFEV